MKTSTPLRIILGVSILAVLALILPPFAYSGDNIEDHIIETETGIYYIVQPGDTLWDLSQKFSDSAWLWPDLWNENQQITNPHLIYPGDRIKLYRRTDTNRIISAPSVPGLKPAGKKFAYSDIDAVGFIRKQVIEPSGNIIDVKRKKTMLSDYDEIYLTPQGGHNFTIGDKYEIRDNETNAYIGIQHYLLGIVEIIQTSQEVVVGKIVKSFRPIEIDDLVTPYLKRPAIIEIKESVPGLEGKLIATEDHLRLIAQDRTAFIDKGEVDGIEIGQFYTIFIRRENRVVSNGQEKIVNLPHQKLGSVLVLHIEENTATALIVKSEPGIESWTPIGTPF
jgi:hypothetical protein